MSVSADVGRKPRQVMEWNEGIEPSPSGWKPGALPVELIPRGVVQSSKDSDRPVTRILRRSTPVAGARVELALRTGYEPGAAPLLRVPRGWLGERSSRSEHVGLVECRPEVRQVVAPSMGLEPTSFSSTGSCSNQLSYDGKRCSGGSPEGWVSEARVANMSVYAVLGRKSRGVAVGTLGIEPRTPG